MSPASTKALIDKKTAKQIEVTVDTVTAVATALLDGRKDFPEANPFDFGSHFRKPKKIVLVVYTR